MRSPIGQSWGSEVPLPRFGHTTTLVDRNRVILFGGATGDSGRYTITQDTFALEMGKPLVLVHEADPDKGGGTLAELRSECPEELRAAIFDAGWPMVVWHRWQAATARQAPVARS